MDNLMTAAMVSPMILAIGGIACFGFAHLAKGKMRAWTGTLAAIFFVATFGVFVVVAVRGFDKYAEIPFAVLVPSDLGLLMGLLVTGLGAVASIYSQGSLDPEGPVEYYYPLLMFALAGTVAIGFATDLFTMFVMVELSAIPSYALVAYNFRKRRAAMAAAIKYLIQGVAGTLTALLGISLLFLATGNLNVDVIWVVFTSPDMLLPLAGILSLAGILIIVGYGVKIAMVPLHTWLPDAYCEAPMGVTAIMAGATKAGALVALFRAVAALPFVSISVAQAGMIVSILAIATMTVGNIIALGQKDLRRMLAYSSIAQMGYILLGFGVGLHYGLLIGLQAGLFYLVVYGIMKGGAFLCAGAFGRATNGGATFEQLKGAGVKNPIVGVSFLLFILGLIGIPATAGFPGKLMLFQAGLEVQVVANNWLNWGTLLSIALALNSALSLGYYVPALNHLLFKHGSHAEHEEKSKIPVAMVAAIVPLAVLTVVFGLYPQALMNLTNPAATLFKPGGWLP
jgi:proton-translocating NADH-quinone oxidoreductase chain N